MKTVIYIDGGAGRVVAAIPALLKYHRQNPDQDWCVIIPSWHYLYWGIPELQDRTFDTETKGIFENLIQNCERFLSPEPYRVPAYFRQEISLSEAFDREINCTDDHSDLGTPVMVTNRAEKRWAKNIIETTRQQQGKTKTILIQPFGRGARVDAGEVLDDGCRSLSIDSYLVLAKKLAVRYNLIFMGDPDFQIPSDSYAHKMPPETDLRMWAAIVEQCDYLVGIDSVAQHFARAFNRPGTVLFGSTFPVNTSYPDWFQIIEKEVAKKYSAIRISALESQLADRLNDQMMQWNENEVNEIYHAIVTHIQAST